MRKIIIFVICSISALVLFKGGECAASTAAMDWQWYFSEVRDDEGNVLAKLENPTRDPLIFDISPDTYKLRAYGTIFNAQALNRNNIDFVNTHTFSEKVLEGWMPFYNTYNINLTSSGRVDRLLPLGIGEHSPFWFMDIYLRDADSSAPEGTYRVYNSGLDIYDLSEPLNQFGRHTIHNISALNEIRWNAYSEDIDTHSHTAIPDPASVLLVLSGVGALLFRKR